MKRCVISSRQPWYWIDQFPDHSIMIVNPDAPVDRYNYLLDHSDYSLLITDQGIQERDGGDHANERVFWYTSGTTGDSKFFGFSSDQVDRMAQTICECYQLNANDRYFGIMPLWHAHGQGFYWAARRAGLEAKFGTIHDRSAMQDLQPTFVTAIPDIMAMIAKLDLRHLRFVRTASAALPDSLFLWLRQRWHIPVIEAFGMTEALGHCFTNPLLEPQRIGTVGMPSGIEASIDQDQHLWIKGACVHQPHWFDTGDLAEQDSCGYYKILGRSSDRINVRGYKIDPISIEQQLRQALPHIQDCVIFGHRFVNCVYTGKVQEDQVRHTLLQIHPACRPRFLLQVHEIPLSPNGKLSRSLLLDHFGCT